MDVDDIAAGLGVPVGDVERVHRLAGDRPSAPLPKRADAPCLALVAVATQYHRDRGIPDAVTRVTLADLGRNLAVDRRIHREGWPVMQSWLTLHARGALYELGRLQHHRSDTGAISLHIPESSPLTPEAIDASLDEARAFFPRHFPDEPYTAFSCGSWLLDPHCGSTCPRAPASSASSRGSSWSPTSSPRAWSSRCRSPRPAPRPAGLRPGRR